MISLILNILGAGLSIWQHKEANKYRDEYADLKQRYYDEKNKNNPDMSVLDNLEFRIVLLGNGFATAATQGQAPSPVSG